MKLFVFSVLAFCACANATFLKNHRLFGGGQKSEPAPIAPAPVETPSSSGGGLGGLASLGKLLLIPLNLKKTLIQSHQKRINSHFDRVIGTLNSLGGSFGGGSSNANAGSSSGTDFSAGTDFGSETGQTYVAGTDNSASAGGLSGSFGGGNGGGSIDYNAIGGGNEISGGSASTSYQGGYTGGESYQGSNSYSGAASGSVGGTAGFAPGSVHTYHPQPAPNTQYSSSPIVLHLYAVENGAQANSVSAPVPDCNTAPIAPAPQQYVSQPIAPAPQQYVSQPIAPAPQQYVSQPIAPQPEQTYETVDFEPPVSSSFSNVEVQAQTMQEISPSNTYLPPFKRRY